MGVGLYGVLGASDSRPGSSSSACGSLEDYLVIPRVLGDAVGLTPLTVLVAVLATTILFGGFAVLLAIPLAAMAATLIDVADPPPRPGRGGGPDGDLPGPRRRSRRVVDMTRGRE